MTWRVSQPFAHPAPQGFTLIEMLTTVAALVILLGLMVSLARDVRTRSANGLTGDILTKLDRLMAQYAQRTGRLPAVPTVVPAYGEPLEDAVRGVAAANNAAFIRALRSTLPLTREFGELQLDTYSDTALNDAWGDPVVFMPAGHPAVGMAPQNRAFFFSAGPDRRYLTRDDNLYSYEHESFDNEPEHPLSTTR
jgi:prepilin-type N-terminal cleavage/methylation domain-containing protein